MSTRAKRPQAASSNGAGTSCRPLFVVVGNVTAGGQRAHRRETNIGIAMALGLARAGYRVVITAGTAVNIPGSTNVIKVDIA